MTVKELDGLIFDFVIKYKRFPSGITMTKEDHNELKEELYKRNPTLPFKCLLYTSHDLVDKIPLLN